MVDFAGHAVASPVDAPGDDGGRADTVVEDRDERQVVLREFGSVGLDDGKDVDVVVNDDWHGVMSSDEPVEPVSQVVEPPAELPPEGHAAHAVVGRLDNLAFEDVPSKFDANPENVAAAQRWQRAQVDDHLGEALDKVVLLGDLPDVGVVFALAGELEGMPVKTGGDNVETHRVAGLVADLHPIIAHWSPPNCNGFPRRTTMEGSPQPSDGSPASYQLRKRVRWISAGTSVIGLGGGLIWLPNNLMADIITGVVFVVLSVLLFLSAVLFSKRTEPARRFVQIIAAARNRRSDR